MSGLSRNLDGTAPSGDAGAPSRRFAGFLARVPNSVRKLVQGESSVDGGSVGSTAHEYYVFLEDMEATCCGKIGTGGKVCIRALGACDIQKHARSRQEGLDAGVYVRGGSDDEVYAFPCVSLADLSEEARQEFLTCKPESLEDARQKLEDYNSLLEKKASGTILFKGAKRSEAEFLSPAAKRTKVNLIDKTEELLRSSPSSFGFEKVANPEQKVILEAFLKRDLLLKLLSSSVMENQEDLDSLLEKIVDLNGQLGVAPVDGPPALWLGFLDLRDEIKLLKQAAGQTVPISFMSTVQSLEGRFNVLDRAFEVSKNEVREAMVDLAEAFVSPSGSVNENQSSGTTSGVDAIAGGEDNPYDFILDRIDKLSEQCNSIAKANSSSANAIKVGKYCFESVDELRGWCEKHLPAEFPFGAFVDIYSFLQRIKSFRDKADPDSLKSMDYRDRLDLTADEAITLEAFSHPLPKGFRGTSSEEGQMASWLPGLKQPEKWEDKSETVGVKIMIKENIEVVRTRVLAVIRHRLANHGEASALARELLSDTIAFLTEFAEFISSTFRTLKLAGFDKTSAWNLVSKLIHRILAVDCNLRRGISFELLDAKEHKALAVSVLWGTFGTHQVLRGYQRHSIENHPSMASEYVRFLVAHTDATKVSVMEQRSKSLEAACKKSEGEVRKLEKEIENQKRSLSTANNKIDDLQKAVKKLQSN